MAGEWRHHASSPDGNGDTHGAGKDLAGACVGRTRVARACGVEPSAPLASMGAYERYGMLQSDSLATYALATSYVENGYLEKRLDAEGQVLREPSDVLLGLCEAQWPYGPWPGVDGHQSA